MLCVCKRENTNYFRERNSLSNGRFPATLPGFGLLRRKFRGYAIFSEAFVSLCERDHCFLCYLWRLSRQNSFGVSSGLIGLLFSSLLPELEVSMVEMEWPGSLDEFSKLINRMNTPRFVSVNLF